MYTFKIYYEEADGDEEKRYLGAVQANTLALALKEAATQYGYPPHDLVAEQVTS